MLIMVFPFGTLIRPERLLWFLVAIRDFSVQLIYWQQSACIVPWYTHIARDFVLQLQPFEVYRRRDTQSSAVAECAISTHVRIHRGICIMALLAPQQSGPKAPAAVGLRTPRRRRRVA